jgi:cell division septum initiation protein DivIVA
VDPKQLDRIRNPNFPLARRGYERREVDNFLFSLAEWLERGGHDEAEGYAVSRKLQRAGETTARVLATAQAEAEQILKEAQAEANKRVRDATASAEKRLESATAQAQRIVEESERRQGALEEVIRDLQSRRRHVVDEIQRLREVLGAAVAAQSAVQPRPKPVAADADDEPTRVAAPSKRAAAGSRGTATGVVAKEA